MKDKYKNSKKNRWHITLIGYYMMILLVPFAAIMALCFSGARLVRDEAIEANRIVIEQLRQVIDNKIKDFEKLSAYIQNDSEFQSVISDRLALEAADRYQLAQLPTKFAGISLSDDLMDEYLVYLPNQRLMINSSNYTSMSGMTDEKFSTFFARIPQYTFLLGQSYKQQMIPVYKENTTTIEHIIYVDSMKGALAKRENAVFAVKLNTSAITNMVDAIDAYDGSMLFCIMDPKENLPIYHSDTQIFTDLNQSGYMDYEEGTFVSLYEKNDYYCYRISSNVTNFEYVVLISSANITKGVNRINLITLICIGIIIFATLMIFRIIRMREYESIATTITLLNDNNKILDDHNAFQFIKNTVSELLVDKKKLEDSLQSSEQYLKNYFLIRILTQEIEDRQSYTKLLAYHNVEFPYSKYRVMLFYKPTKINGEKMQVQYQELLEKIEHEIKTTLYDEMVTQSMYLNGMLVMIINYDFTLLENEQIIDKVDHYKRMMEVENVITTLSSRKDSYFELNQAYDEAMETLEQCLIEGIVVKEYRKHVRRAQADHLKYYQYEENFRNALDEGNYRNAEAILNNMLAVLKSTFGGNSRGLRCKLYGIVNILMNAIAKDYEADPSMDKIYNLAVGKWSTDELIKGIKEVLQQLLDSNKSFNLCDFSNEVEQYVEKHCLESDLSVGMIADEFQVDLSVLSKRFKKERNVNISDYIHIVRIKKAKVLLKDTKITIKQIAEQCGYLNSDVFIRVFKRYEGITPGKYRTSNTNGDA